MYTCKNGKEEETLKKGNLSMLLFFTTLLFSLTLSSDDNTSIHVTVDNWVQQLLLKVPDIHWLPTEPCNETMTVLSKKKFSTLDEFTKGNVYFCFLKKTIGNVSKDASKCDIILNDVNANDWNEFSPSDKALLLYCMEMKMTMETEIWLSG